MELLIGKFMLWFSNLLCKKLISTHVNNGSAHGCHFCYALVLFRSPDTARVKAKMIYASSKERFRRELDGVHYELQATDPTEMDMEVIKDRVK